MYLRNSMHDSLSGSYFTKSSRKLSILLKTSSVIIINVIHFIFIGVFAFFLVSLSLTTSE